ncbi:DNA polymerase eta isoform X2 [Punica granatum]|uniref:DNA polymerase eta n=1 Tax=Punica granatum TaxID=22663 RepID=A0A6P8DFY1_PUNGR|nr:DNA polymerase eta isoform X2 [Punica granatum]
MPVAKPEASDSRVIAHIDMDCFYVQVEQRKHPQLRGLPTAVVQYNSWKGGGLIAVSYEARNYGVKRSMRGDEAKEVCPEIQLVQVPVARGKADLNTYREAGSQVVSILARRGRCERSSIDEVYLDLTDAAERMLTETSPHSLETIIEEALKSHVLGITSREDGIDVKEKVREWLCKSDADRRDKLLACGVLIVADLRMQVLQETQFTCSAGIAHNKMLAKLASAMNKPAQQTAVPFSSVKGLLESFPIKKMKQLGGKLGSSLQTDLGVNTVGDLWQFSEGKLQERYGINTGTWLWNIARGINGEEVEGRLLPKSHGSGKTFPGPRALKNLPSVQHWLNELCEELSERLQSDLEHNRRIARNLTLHAHAYKPNDSDSHDKFPSKSCALRYGTLKIQEDAMNLFQVGLREFLDSSKVTQGGWGITGLSVSASKIIAIPSGTCSIKKYFQGQQPICSSSKPLEDGYIETTEHPSLSFSGDEDSTSVPIELPGQEVPYFPCNGVDFGQEAAASTSGLTFCVGRESCSESNLVEPESTLPEEPRREPKTHALDQQVRKNPSVEKGKSSSILDFFRRADTNSPLQKQDQADKMQGRHQSHRRGSSQERETWHYKADEIDPSVINELPPEFQEEVRDWLRPLKRPNVVKGGSGVSIASFFSSTNKP